LTDKNLEDRVENLERIVAPLVGLPRQMETLSSQFLQLRQEVRAEVSDIHTDVAGLRGEVGGLRGGVGELRGEVGELRGEVGELRGEVGELRGQVGELGEKGDRLRGEVGELRGALTALGVDLRAEMASMHYDLAKAILANGVEMRALHEEVMERLNLLGGK